MIYQSMYTEDGLWFTFHKKKSGLKNKMDQMTSLVIEHNDICHQRRRNKGFNQNCVCERCYSYIQSTLHPSIRNKMTINSNLLNSKSYKPKKIQTINNTLRYISFGDLQNKQQALNIFKHAKINKTLHKALWTKQVKHVQETIKETKQIIPRFNLIWSCSRLNSTKFIIPEGFTKSFYVYTTEETRESAFITAKEQGFNPFKCEATSCHECQHCYKDSNASIVMELLR